MSGCQKNHQYYVQRLTDGAAVECRRKKIVVTFTLYDVCVCSTSSSTALTFTQSEFLECGPFLRPWPRGWDLGVSEKWPLLCLKIHWRSRGWAPPKKNRRHLYFVWCVCVVVVVLHCTHIHTKWVSQLWPQATGCSSSLKANKIMQSHASSCVVPFFHCQRVLTLFWAIGSWKCVPAVV